MRKLAAILRPFVVAAIALASVTTWVLVHLDEHGIVLYGTFLQLVAMYAVVKGLLGSLKILAPQRLADDLRNWVRELRFWRAQESTGTIHLDASLPAMTMTGGTAVSEPPQDLREEVAELRQKLDVLHTVMVKEFAQHSTNTAELVEAERQRREAEIVKLREEVAAVTVADPWTTIFGTLCLFFGVLLTGCAPYIVQYR